MSIDIHIHIHIYIYPLLQSGKSYLSWSWSQQILFIPVCLACSLILQVWKLRQLLQLAVSSSRAGPVAGLQGRNQGSWQAHPTNLCC